MRVCWCPFDTRWMGWHSRSLSFGYFSKTLVKGSRFSSMALGVQVSDRSGFSTETRPSTASRVRSLACYGARTSSFAEGVDGREPELTLGGPSLVPSRKCLLEAKLASVEMLL